MCVFPMPTCFPNTAWCFYRTANSIEFDDPLPKMDSRWTFDAVKRRNMLVRCDTPMDQLDLLAGADRGAKTDPDRVSSICNELLVTRSGTCRARGVV